MADDLDPKDPNEEFGRTNPEEDVSGSAEEEFEDIDEADSDEDDLES